MGWAGPAQPTGPDSAQKCWADLGLKWVGPISAQILLSSSGPGPAWPNNKHWRGELFSPPPSCMQNV